MDINWHCHCGKQYAGPQKIKNKDTQLETKKRETELPHDPAIPFLDIYPEETKIEKYVYTNVHCSTVYNS